MRVLWTVLLLVLVTPGCAELQDHRYRVVNHRRARHAWRECGVTSVANAAASGHYKRGWIAGYYEVLTGGADVPPVVPPKKYWAPRFQTPEGQAAISDWYQGFQMGAMAAKSAPIRSELPVCVPESPSPLLAECAPVEIPEEHFVPEQHFVPERHIVPEQRFHREPSTETEDALPQLPELPRYIVPQPHRHVPAPPRDDAEYLPPVSVGPYGNGPQLVPPHARHRQTINDPRRHASHQYVRPVAAVRYRPESRRSVNQAESANPRRVVPASSSAASRFGATHPRHSHAPAPCRRLGSSARTSRPIHQPARRSGDPSPARRVRQIPSGRAYRAGMTSDPSADVDAMVGIVRIFGGRTLTVVTNHVRDLDLEISEGAGVAVATKATTVVARAQSADLSQQSRERPSQLTDRYDLPTTFVRDRQFNDTRGEDIDDAQL